MDFLTALAIIVPSLASIFHAYLSYKKYKEPKRDELWDLAFRIAESNGCVQVEDIVEIYVVLKELKSNNYSCVGFNSVDEMQCFLHNACFERKAGKINTVDSNQC